MLARALLAIVTTAAALAVSPVASAEHTVFDYTVDRFEATGNLIGAFVDEFDDGVVTWNQNFPGNAFETGGLLHLASPGVHTENLQQLNPDLTLDVTDVIAPVSVADGSGDFVATSTWTVLPNPPGGFYGMIFVSVRPGIEVESIAIGVRNFSASSVVPPFSGDPGLAVELSRAITDQGTGFVTTLEPQSLAIDAGDVTGDIVVRLNFSDASNEVVGSYSLDGGTIFASPFDPIPSQLPIAAFGAVGLVADPTTVAAPVPVLPAMGVVALGTLILASVAMLRRRYPA